MKNTSVNNVGRNLFVMLTATLVFGGFFVGTQQVFASNHIDTVVVGTQNPNPVAPGSFATYTISFTSHGSGADLATLSIISWSPSTPVGVSASFSPNPRDITLTSTLTISTTASTLPGTYTFTVRAVADATVTGTGTLIVQIPPKLTINKVLIPSTDTGLFNLQIDGSTVGTGANVGSGGTTGAVTSIVGSHTVSETAGTSTTLSDYTSVISGDCASNGSVTLSSGDNKVCTITNTKKGTIIINKTAIGGTGTFPFTATGSGISNFDIDTTQGPTKTFANVAPGTYTIAETESALTGGWFFTSLQCSETGTANTTTNFVTATINVDAGETVTCDYVNTRRGTIIIHKDVVGPDGSPVADGTFFSLHENGGPTYQVSENSDMIFTLLVPGAYVITEDADPNYDFVSFSTDDNAEADGAQIAIAAGQTVTLTITNKQKQGTLTIIKHVANHGIKSSDANDFTFEVNGGTATNFTAEDGSMDGQNVVQVNPGAFAVTEDVADGYAQTLAGCSGTMASNGTATCTITNSDIPTGQGAITIVKSVQNTHGGGLGAGSFTLKLTKNGDEPTTTTVTNGQANFVEPGDYTVSETDSTSLHYAQTGISCVGGESSNGSLTLAAQQAYVCTITNTDVAPSLTLQKVVTNDNGGTATASEWTVAATGSITLSGAGTVSSGADFIAGTYTLSETPVNPESELNEKYNAGAWSCTNGVSVNGSNQITIAFGQTTTCSVTNNDKQATLTIVKNTGGEGDGTFGFNVTPTSEGSTQTASLPTEDGTATSSLINLNKGSYNVTENAAGGWNLLSVSCVYDNHSVGNEIAGGELITVDNGDHVTCTFTNTKKAVLKIKKVVINDNGGTKTAANFSFKVNGGEAAAFEADGENDLIKTAGNYTITETADPGYSTTYSNCSEINLIAASTQTCTITNDDIRPKLTVTKVVINDNSGTKTVENFPLFAGDAPVSSGAQGSFNAGTYAIHETSDSGYSASFGGDCNADGNVTLAPGDIKTCIITNNDIAPNTPPVPSGGGGGGAAAAAGFSGRGAAGDLNHDGRVDVLDLNILLVNWGDHPIGFADLNSDGKVDILDFNLLMVNWSL